LFCQQKNGTKFSTYFLELVQGASISADKMEIIVSGEPYISTKGR